MRLLALRRAGAAHGDGLHAVAAQEVGERAEVDLGFRDGRQVDHHEVVVEDGGVAEAAFELGAERLEVGGLDDHRDKRHRGAFEVEHGGWV